ncbi:MAG: hypothetical protein ACT4PW_12095 [Acidimicrobiia bacterium]
MGMFTIFAMGYVVGARTGKSELSDLARSAQAVYRSDEFGELVQVTRSHLGHMLRELADIADGAAPAAVGAEDEDLVARVRSLFSPSFSPSEG